MAESVSLAALAALSFALAVWLKNSCLLASDVLLAEVKLALLHPTTPTLLNSICPSPPPAPQPPYA